MERSIKHLGITALILLLFATSCSRKESTIEHAIANETLFPKGERTPEDKFVGEAYLQRLLPRDSNNNFAMGCVTFEPGARTNWHSHPKGQVLIVTSGEGFNQEEGKPLQGLKKGDVVNIPANVPHWHGATANAQLVHIAITNYDGETNAVWNAPVTEEEYKAANN